MAKRPVNAYLEEELVNELERRYGKGQISRAITDICDKWIRTQLGDTIRLIVCANCGSRFSALLDECPNCKAEWRKRMDAVTKIEELAYKKAYDLYQEEQGELKPEARDEGQEGLP